MSTTPSITPEENELTTSQRHEVENRLEEYIALIEGGGEVDTSSQEENDVMPGQIEYALTLIAERKEAAIAHKIELEKANASGTTELTEEISASQQRVQNLSKAETEMSKLKRGLVPAPNDGKPRPAKVIQPLWTFFSSPATKKAAINEIAAAQRPNADVVLPPPFAEEWCPFIKDRFVCQIKQGDKSLANCGKKKIFLSRIIMNKKTPEDLRKLIKHPRQWIPAAASIAISPGTLISSWVTGELVLVVLGIAMNETKAIQLYCDEVPSATVSMELRKLCAWPFGKRQKLKGFTADQKASDGHYHINPQLILRIWDVTEASEIISNAQQGAQAFAESYVNRQKQKEAARKRGQPTGGTAASTRKTRPKKDTESSSAAAAAASASDDVIEVSWARRCV